MLHRLLLGPRRLLFSMPVAVYGCSRGEMGSGDPVCSDSPSSTRALMHGYFQLQTKAVQLTSAVPNSI